MQIKINCDVTEYIACPEDENIQNIFTIYDKCFIIEFCDKDENILYHSEISIEDAKKLAKMILNY
jgi:hypothetical protein